MSIQLQKFCKNDVTPREEGDGQRDALRSIVKLKLKGVMRRRKGDSKIL